MIVGRIGRIGRSGGFSLAPSAPFVGVLDLVGVQSAGAYSLARRLTGAYTGPLIRVRRSSDNAETDIGYTSTGLLDSAALTAFVGAGDGFVVRCYDQSGFVRDAVQTLTTRQPRIVLGGVVQTINGQPAPRYNGVAFEHALTTPTRTLPITVTIFGVASPTEVTGQRMWLGGSTGQIFKFGYTTQDFSRVNGQTATSALTYATGVPSVRSGRLNGSVMTAWRNGTQAAQLVTANPTPQTAAPWIGGAGDGQMWPGHVGDVILYDVALTDTQRQLVERDLGASFNITVA